ncbi:MAG: UDP-N-acetylmuramoyl-tripeptide--D-alanyl-D-alanine ligase [Flavobacteriales bacterium]|nr:UDP-N-acetylmuramoyl-tripeptide--D-alanyl-D-alanine ligase [Flavobacteriales bacterium]
MTSTTELRTRFLECSGACTDTRQLLADGMFFALKGPNFDANAFAPQALTDGCRYAVVDDPALATQDRILLVADVLKALQDLGRHHRRQFNIPVIGITGSNGKTTTKELVHAVLAADRPTLATAGNLNNHIGVPLTLLRLKPEHRIAIIEMGANHVGDIAELTGIAEPTHGLITNIGRAHLEGFGSDEGVIRAKTEMYGFISAHDGLLFVNADDQLLMDKSAGAMRSTYGTSPAAELCVRLADGAPFMAVSWAGTDGRERTVTTKLIGNYNLPNAAVAIAIGRHFNVPDDTIASELEAYTPSNNRSQFTDTGRNQLVLDAYNANPSSMKVALENFAAMTTGRPKLAVLGGMKELGADSRSEHEALIALSRTLKMEAVFIGPEFMELAASGITVHPDAATALEAFMQKPLTGHLILVKGSRGTKLETLVPAF